MANNIYVNEKLDIIPTSELISNFLDLSLTSLFSVEIKNAEFGSKFTQKYISLLAYEAVLPGTSLQTGQVFGDRQGITETYATQRVYPPIDISFYIRRDYGTISYFENWMNNIASLQGDDDQLTSLYKFTYPDTYKKNINIIKYERESRPKESRITSTGTTGATLDPKTVTYTLFRAYPTNIISIPVSYDQSNILKTTITFNYDRYFLQRHI